MQTIVKDTYRGTHDMEKGMCSTSFYKKWGDEIFKIYGGVWKRLGRKKVVAPKHGCWENLARALKPHGVPMEDVPSPLNIFQTMVINAKTGSMRYSMTRPRPGGDMMDLRCEMDCLVGISACPEGGTGKRSPHRHLQELKFQWFQMFQVVFGAEYDWNLWNGWNDWNSLHLYSLSIKPLDSSSFRKLMSVKSEGLACAALGFLIFNWSR